MRKFFVMVIAGVIFQATTALSAGEGPINGAGILYTEPVKAVIFAHKAHTKAGLSCVRCHSGLFEMEALKVQEKKDFNMEALYKGKYCGACHNGKDAFASNTQCARCHLRVKGLHPGQRIMQRDIPEYKTSEFFGKGQRTVRFNHEIHTLDLFCSGCHPRLFSIKKGSNKITMADHGKGGKCFFCHDGNKVFSVNSCNRCHAKVEMPREVIAYGKGEKEILFRHQTHSGKLKCGTCHTKLFPFQKGVTKIAFAEHNSGKACFNCHTGKNGAAFYDCSRCHKDRGAAAPQAALTYTIKDTGPVNFSHKNHASFACGQCHPDLFAMKKGGTKMAMAEMYQGKSCGTCHDGKKAFRAMECAKCHKMN